MNLKNVIILNARFHTHTHTKKKTHTHTVKPSPESPPGGTVSRVTHSRPGLARKRGRNPLEKNFPTALSTAPDLVGNESSMKKEQM